MGNPATTLKPRCPSHVIKQGSSLSSIAQEYTAQGHSITWQEICRFNSIENCHFIQANEVIIIPVGACKDASTPGQTTQAGQVTTQPGQVTTQAGQVTYPGQATAQTPTMAVADSGSIAAVTIFAGALALMHAIVWNSN